MQDVNEIQLGYVLVPVHAPGCSSTQGNTAQPHDPAMAAAYGLTYTGHEQAHLWCRRGQQQQVLCCTAPDHLALVCALGQLVDLNRLSSPTITCVATSGTTWVLRLQLDLPQHLLTQQQHHQGQEGLLLWKLGRVLETQGCRASALVARHLLPVDTDAGAAAAALLQEATPGGPNQQQPQQQQQQQQRFTLADCFRELPTLAAAAAAAERQAAHAAALARAQQEVTEGASTPDGSAVVQQVEPAVGASDAAAGGLCGDDPVAGLQQHDQQLALLPEGVVVVSQQDENKAQAGQKKGQQQEEEQQQQREGVKVTEEGQQQGQQQQQQQQQQQRGHTRGLQMQGQGVAALPSDFLLEVLGALEPQDVLRAACVCYTLWRLTQEAVPGLKLKLYPHQRQALKRMQEREQCRSGVTRPHPYIRPYPTSCPGLTLYVNQVTGELSLVPPDPLPECRGGMFCDEPGLGKTISCLSLILKTRGTLPEAPPGASVTWTRNRWGQRVGLYVLEGACGTAAANGEGDAAWEAAAGQEAAAAAGGAGSSRGATPARLTRRGSYSSSGAGGLTWQQEAVRSITPSMYRHSNSSARRSRRTAAAAAAGGDSGAGDSAAEEQPARSFDQLTIDQMVDLARRLLPIECLKANALSTRRGSSSSCRHPVAGRAGSGDGGCLQVHAGKPPRPGNASVARARTGKSVTSRSLRAASVPETAAAASTRRSTRHLLAAGATGTAAAAGVGAAGERDLSSTPRRAAAVKAGAAVRQQFEVMQAPSASSGSSSSSSSGGSSEGFSSDDERSSRSGAVVAHRARAKATTTQVSPGVTLTQTRSRSGTPTAGAVQWQQDRSLDDLYSSDDAGDTSEAASDSDDSDWGVRGRKRGTPRKGQNNSRRRSGSSSRGRSPARQQQQQQRHKPSEKADAAIAAMRSSAMQPEAPCVPVTAGSCQVSPSPSSRLKQVCFVAEPPHPGPAAAAAARAAATDAVLHEDTASAAAAAGPAASKLAAHSASSGAVQAPGRVVKRLRFADQDDNAAAGTAAAAPGAAAASGSAAAAGAGPSAVGPSAVAAAGGARPPKRLRFADEPSEGNVAATTRPAAPSMLAGAAADVDGPHLGAAAAAGDRGSSGRALGIRLADQSVDSQQQKQQQQQKQKQQQKRVCFGDSPSVGPMPCPASASAQQTPAATPAAAAAAPEVKQALDMRDNSSSSEGADSDGAALWVVCDGCQKWRQLSGDTKVEPGGLWYCWMHPDLQRRGCHAPAEADKSQDNCDTCVGYCAAGEAMGSADNTAHYRALLGAYRHLREVWEEAHAAHASHGLLGWLVKQDPEALVDQGVTVPREYRSLQYGPIFKAMSLELVPVPKKRHKRQRSTSAPPLAAAGAGGDATTTAAGPLPSAALQAPTAGTSTMGAAAAGAVAAAFPTPAATVPAAAAAAAAASDGGGAAAAAAAASSKRRAAGGLGVSAEAHTWRQAPYLRGLRLDMVSLYAALLLGPEVPAAKMYLSTATLVVVPDTLIDHWQQQIADHVRPGLLKVCVLADSSRSNRSNRSQDLHTYELAWDYDVVLTTFSRLSRERGKQRDSISGVGAKSSGSGGRVEPCLLNVHWLRIILDEGHTLGASLAPTNKFSCACELTAERRWVTTGTPTPATAGGSDAAHLQPLLQFLHCSPWAARSAWDAALRRPLAKRSEWARRLLLAELQHWMIRASKADLARLPPCYRRVVLLDFTPTHAASYNDLVELVKRNLLTSDWCDENHVESFLGIGTQQVKWAKEMLQNIRQCCCVAGALALVPQEQHILEALQLLAERNGEPQPDGTYATDWPDRPGAHFLPWGHPLVHLEEGIRYGCNCQVCGVFSRQPMFTPCGHMGCLDCIAASRTACPLPSCRVPYKMQAVDDPERTKVNKAPQWEVPIELIEWQVAVTQRSATGVTGGAWSAEWQTTRSSKVEHLLKRLKELGAMPTKPRGGGAAAAAAGEGEEAGGVGGAGPSSSGTGSSAARPWSAGSLTYHHHRQQQQQQAVGGLKGILKSSSSSYGGASGAGPGVKVLIYTQFWVHRKLIEQELFLHGAPFVCFRKDMPQPERSAALNTFRRDPATTILLMDESGALGLDLSFVNHIFLMEPLTDAALEQQVISRAWRMGCTSTVHVEVLAMAGTAEEHLVALRQRAERGQLSAEVANAAAHQAAKMVAAAAGTSTHPGAAAGPAVEPAAEAPMQQGGEEEGAPEQAPGREGLMLQWVAAAATGAGAGEVALKEQAVSAVDAAGLSGQVVGNQENDHSLRNLILLQLKKVRVAQGH